MSVTVLRNAMAKYRREVKPKLERLFKRSA